MSPLVPYALLLAAIILALIGSTRPAALVLVGATIAGLVTARLTWAAVPSLLVMAGLAQSARLGWAALAWALLLSNYWLPGFRNLPVFEQTRFTADAAPFTMYLNFDKTAAGLLLYLFAVPRPRWTNAGAVPRAWAAVTGALMALSLATGYVRFDPHESSGGVIWALNNFFFVALAEEAVFRGVLQRKLTAWWGRWPAILVAAAAFGLQHYRGGPAYEALAAVAGVFYGWAFDRTGRLEASMLVHFGLNLTHFLLFTYPSLTP